MKQNYSINNNNKNLVEFMPRIKMIIFFIITSMSFMAKNNFVLMFYAILVVLLWIFIGEVIGALKIGIFYGGMFILAFVINRMPNSQITQVFNNFSFFLLRLPIFLIMGSWFTKKINIGQLIASLESMRVPKGMVISLAVVFRFLPTVKKEIYTISNTMKQRNIGINIKNIVLHPLRTCEYVIVPMLLRSITIADELSTSAITRGLDTTTKRTTIFETKIKINNIVFLLLVVVYMVIANYLSRVIEVTL